MTTLEADNTDRRTDLRRRERFERLRADLLARLGAACRTMPQPQLHDLVAGMTRLRLKYELTSALPGEMEQM